MPATARYCSACGSSVSSVSQAPTTVGSTSVGRLHSSDSIDAGRFVPGAIVAARYRIIGLLGRGGMGEIYRADDLKLGQPIALKFLPKALASDPARLERFHAEVRLARQVSHPAVCRVYDIQDWEGQPFLAMEYVDGEDLASLLKRIGRLPGDKALEIARQICAGVAAAHERGVLHRDLKPANVMIDGQGRARIADFGLAALEDEGPGTGISGTLGYMAPEQFEGKGASIQSDLYSLGLVLYEIYTGRSPFGSLSLEELKRRKSEPVRPPSEISSDIDATVERVILRCVDPNPKTRPASARQVAFALPGGDPLAAALAAGETPSPEMVAAAGETEGLRPGVAWACLAIALLGLAAAFLYAGRIQLVRRLAPDQPPEVLAERARGIQRALGWTGTRRDSAFGFELDNDYVAWVVKNDSSLSRWDRTPVDLLGFWYRESPRPLAPRVYWRQTVSASDPPRDVSGMTEVWLDVKGRLAGFAAVPPQIAEPDEAVREPDWGRVFAEAGLDPARWTPAAPRWVPPEYADARAAWEGEHPDFPGVSMRIEAAAYRGKPCYFQLVGPWTKPQRMEAEALALRVKVLLGIILFFFVVLLVAGAFLARRNLVLGRGDRRGAFRLAVFVFATQEVAWLFGASHVLDLQEIVLFVVSLGYALYNAALTWLVYIAMEPYVRRRWPQTLVSWNRLLGGKWRDPLVGRDVLVGCAAAGVAFALSWLAVELRDALGYPPPRPVPLGLGLLTGWLQIASAVLGQVPQSILQGLIPLFLLVVFRLVLRNTWATAGVFALILGVATSLSPGSTWIDVALGILVVGSLVFVLIRFGVLAAMSVGFLGFALECPAASDLSAWYAWIGLTGLGIAAALAVAAFYASLGGRPAFGSARLDD